MSRLELTAAEERVLEEMVEKAAALLQKPGMPPLDRKIARLLGGAAADMMLTPERARH